MAAAATGGAAGGGGGSSSGFGGRRDGETAEQRARRHADKKRRVEEHRSEILRRVNQASGRNKLHKADELVMPLVFDNTLPPVPVEAKGMAFPFEEDFTYGYDWVSGVPAEDGFLYGLHPEGDGGVAINLIDPAQYLAPPAAAAPPLHPTDDAITSAAYALPANTRAEVAAQDEHVDWMRRSTYMHLDLYDAVYKHADPTAVTVTALEQKRQALARAFAGRRKDRIDASFAAVGGDATLAHPRNRGLAPLRVWHVLPDTELWARHLISVAFDANPDEAAAGPGATGGSAAAAAAAAASSRARLEAGILRTPAAQPVDLREGAVQVDYLLPPPGSRGREGATLAGSRSYHMVVEKQDAARPSDQYILRWDDLNAAVYFAPVRARATAIRIARGVGDSGDAAASGGGGGSGGGRGGSGITPVTVARRALLHDERDAEDAADADLDEPEPQGIKEAIAHRRLVRVSEARAAAAAAAAAADAAAASAASSGAAATAGGTQVSGVKRPAGRMSGGGDDDEAQFSDDDN